MIHCNFQLISSHQEDTKMLFLILVACYAATTLAGCPMRPSAGQTSAGRTPGDGGYRILISGTSDKYIPDAIYTISLQGIRLVLWFFINYLFFLSFFFSFHKNNFFMSKPCSFFYYVFQGLERTNAFNNSRVSHFPYILSTHRTIQPFALVTFNYSQIPWLPSTRTALTLFPKLRIIRNPRLLRLNLEFFLYETFFFFIFLIPKSKKIGKMGR